MIEILWSVMGGLIFSMLPQLFITGSSGAGTFSIERWFIWWRWSSLDSSGSLDEFIFGFFFTLILIWSIKKYRQPSGESLENLLRKWHFEDPPDEWEEKRNDLIELIQGNRNPFIDQPDLVERVAGF